MTETASSTCLPASERDLLDGTVELQRHDVVVEHLGAEALGLGLHLGHEVGPLDAVGEPGEVLDLGRVHEVAAGFDGARDDEGLEVGSGSVDGGRVSGRARSDDDDVTHVCAFLSLIPSDETHGSRGVFHGPGG